MGGPVFVEFVMGKKPRAAGRMGISEGRKKEGWDPARLITLQVSSTCSRVLMRPKKLANARAFPFLTSNVYKKLLGISFECMSACITYAQAGPIIRSFRGTYARAHGFLRLSNPAQTLYYARNQFSFPCMCESEWVGHCQGGINQRNWGCQTLARETHNNNNGHLSVLVT